MFGVCGGAEEILVSIRGFNIEICREGIIIIDGNSDVKKMYGFFGLFCGEFDGGMGVVECIDEVGEFVLSMCPNHRNVVDEIPPHKRVVRGFVKGIGFKDSHKDICVGWCHSCTHCCAMFL